MQKEIKKLDLKFEPSIKILLRIMRSILEHNHIGNTALAMESNINYTVLSRYIDWLEKKSIIEPVLVGHKANISMTEKGREFAIELHNFSLQFASLIDKIST
ncbi:MAG: winged helix-turn-helix domain-containing protein [Nitrosotalea sp.]